MKPKTYSVTVLKHQFFWLVFCKIYDQFLYFKKFHQIWGSLIHVGPPQEARAPSLKTTIPNNTLFFLRRLFSYKFSSEMFTLSESRSSTEQK